MTRLLLQLQRSCKTRFVSYGPGVGSSAFDSEGGALPSVQCDSLQELIEVGYKRVPGVLGSQGLTLFRALAKRLSSSVGSNEQRATYASVGSLLDALVDEESIELITWPRAFAELGAFGFRDPRFLHGIYFEKPPHTPRTFWHQDGTSWNDPSSYDAVPQEVILLYYLVDTGSHNGALRVIPASHRRRHPLHDWLAQSRVDDLRRNTAACDPAFHTYPEEVSVPVTAGDLVVLDSRLLHAAHANTSDFPRPALSLWYATDASALPERIRARFDHAPCEGSRLPYAPSGWSPAAQRRLARVLPPRYCGTASPLPVENNPGSRLS